MINHSKHKKSLLCHNVQTCIHEVGCTQHRAPSNFCILGGSTTRFEDKLCLWDFSAVPEGLWLLQGKRTM